MKIFAMVAGIALVFVGTSFGSAQSLGAHSRASVTAWPHGYTSIMLPAIGTFGVRRAFLPQQAAATPTPGTTSTPVPASSPTPNPAYPDPVTLLQNSFNVYGQLSGVHFENITDGDQQSTVKLHIDAVGDANCTGPSLKAKVTGKETLEGTSQSQSSKFNLIQVKNSYYKKGKSTKNLWKKVAAKSATAFSFTIDNPLACPDASAGAGSGSGSGSGTPTTQIKDLTNVGPDTVAGVSVWHIQATEIDVDPTTGQTTQALLDYYVGQAHPLPYKYSATVNDTTNGIKLVFQQLLGKFGEKVTIKAPKVGSSKP
jgi:hypothetical protein